MIMKVLLADPNRDFLSGYGCLLEKAGHSVSTAFDGTQVLSLLGSVTFDLAVLNEHLPRIAHESMIHSLHGEHIPVIVLLDRPVHIRHLCRREPADAYLSFPFTPTELETLLHSVTDKAARPVHLNCMGISLDIERFRVSGTDVYLTAGEMDVLSSLCREEGFLPYAQRVYVQSLNEKLANVNGFPLRIAYLEEKGYRLVKKV